MRELISLYLEKAGFQTVHAQNGENTLARVRAGGIDLVVLDIMMPDLDGREVCRRLREDGFVGPVLMLTALGDVADRVSGLDLGADDYMVKPFDGQELVARVQALLRRAGGPVRSNVILRRGPLLLNTGTRQVQLGNRDLPLTAREFDLLALLASYPGQVFSREQLLERLAPDSLDVDNRAIDSHIKNLRLKLGLAAGLIVTVWGVGYKLEAES